MSDTAVDAFFLFNERESAVSPVAAELEQRGVTTHLWPRDVPMSISERRTRRPWTLS